MRRRQREEVPESLWEQLQSEKVREWAGRESAWAWQSEGVQRRALL